MAVAIKEYEVFQQPTKCGGRKQHKGTNADCCFLEPEGANSTRSSYRLLYEVCVASTIYFPIILAIGGIFSSNFDQILVLWNPLNAPRSDVIDIYIYHVAMQGNRFSYAAAIGFFRSVIAFGLLFGANQVVKKT